MYEKAATTYGWGPSSSGMGRNSKDIFIMVLALPLIPATLFLMLFRESVKHSGENRRRRDLIREVESTHIWNKTLKRWE